MLIHEVAEAKPEFAKLPGMQGIIDLHTSPHDAGRVFDRARPKLAVFTHISMLGNAAIPEPGVEEIVAQTRETY